MLFMSNVYINKRSDENQNKNQKLGKQNRDFDLKAILDKVAISTSMLEIDPALLNNICM